jgi:hypothetical protein
MEEHVHTYTWVSGFGLEIVPFSPYRSGRDVAGPNTLDVSYFVPEGELFARIIADGTGAYTSKIERTTPSLYDVLEIIASANPSDWRVETSAFWCGWPPGFDLLSTKFPAQSTIVDLEGESGDRIYIQTSADALSLNGMIAPGQRKVGIDEAEQAIDLEYIYDRRRWIQRHALLPLPTGSMVVSGQAVIGRTEGVFAAAKWVRESITLTDGGSPNS